MTLQVLGGWDPSGESWTRMTSRGAMIGSHIAGRLDDNIKTVVHISHYRRQSLGETDEDHEDTM
jgi:hypothetical protein